MEKKLIERLSEEEQEKNTIVLKEFYHAFSSGVINNVGKYLHEEGVFFKSWNKGKTLGYLHQLINKRFNLSESDYIYFNLGFSYDNIVGHPVIEIRFIPIFHFDDDFNFIADIGSPPNIELNETVFRFSVTFKDNKIYTMRHPKKVIASLRYFAEYN